MDENMELKFDDEELDIPDNDIEDSYTEQISEDTEVYEETTPEVAEDNSKKGKKKKEKPVKEPKAKKEKPAKEPKAKKEKPVKEQAEVILHNRLLYILTDKKTDGLLPYARACGLNVAAILDNVEELKNLMLMQYEDMRIVVIDTGTGKFITPTIRKSIVDIIGMSDETTKFTVFYTDSLLKSDSSAELGKVAKTIDWIKYKSTPICMATMLSYKENYLERGSNKLSSKSPEEILGYQGERVDAQLENLSTPSINPAGLAKQVVETEAESLRRFKLRL